MQQLWLVTVPNNKESSESTFKALERIGNNDLCHLHKFTIPPLVVGTLDSLIALSDELNKINSFVENIVRKVERQYYDINVNDTSLLKVNDIPIDRYFKQFQWDFAKYQHQGRQISDIVLQIQSLATKIDDELKKLTVLYNEKNLALSSLLRKKTINLATSDFEDFLKPDLIAKLEILDTSSLQTVFVVVPKSLHKEFENTYETLGSSIAAFGGPDWSSSEAIGTDDKKYGNFIDRLSKKGSPVVPNSHKIIYEEGESILYSVVILKGHYSAGNFKDDVFINGNYCSYLDAVKLCFREKRFILREYVYDARKAGNLNSLITNAENELKQVKETIIRWCKAHFGESYIAWVHLKVIRGFVESVLRYGLPLDFLSVFVEPNNKKEKVLKEMLTKTILHLRPELDSKKLTLDTEEDEDTENLPFVCLKFPVIGGSSSNNSQM